MNKYMLLRKVAQARRHIVSYNKKRKLDTTGDLGARPPAAANEFLRFSHKKNTHFGTLFYRKWAFTGCSHYKQCKNISVTYV